jgi:hypothetical protein
MTCIERPYQIGDRLRVKRCVPFEMPAELTPGAVVIVAAKGPGTTQVRDPKRREGHVSMGSVTTGMPPNNRFSRGKGENVPI